MNIRERIKSVVKDFERDVFVSLGAVIDFVVEIETRFLGKGLKVWLKTSSGMYLSRLER